MEKKYAMMHDFHQLHIDLPGYLIIEEKRKLVECELCDSEPVSCCKRARVVVVGGCLLADCRYCFVVVVVVAQLAFKVLEIVMVKLQTFLH